VPYDWEVRYLYFATQPELVEGVAEWPSIEQPLVGKEWWLQSELIPGPSPELLRPLHELVVPDRPPMDVSREFGGPTSSRVISRLTGWMCGAIATADPATFPDVAARWSEAVARWHPLESAETLTQFLVGLRRLCERAEAIAGGVFVDGDAR